MTQPTDEAPVGAVSVPPPGVKVEPDENGVYTLPTPQTVGKAKDRISVVERIIYQALTVGEQPYAVEHTFYRDLVTSDEQVYERKLKVGEEWQPLDLGWGKDWERIGLVYVENLEGQFKQLQPTEEEQAEANAKVLELSYDGVSDEAWLVPPKETFRGYPAEPGRLMIRCQSGMARIMVRIFPG